MTAQSDLRFTFSAGPDAFEVVEFLLTEGLSETFRPCVDLNCANPAVYFAQARTGAIELHSHFTTCSDAFWKRIVADLPHAKDYS